jgi:phosphonate degradation associated HDIG domain protein
MPEVILENNLRDEICALYGTNGTRAYGLYQINQVQHALQAAALAEAQGLGSAMVMACLLHDVGHMVHDLGEAPAEHGVDDRHEELGARWTARHFVPGVSEPIRLHVAAKRYLCTIDPAYQAGLSKDSQISLVLQGGHMSEAEQASFLDEVFAQDAIALRRIDELAKDPDAVTPTVDAFLAKHLKAAMLAPGAEAPPN